MTGKVRQLIIGSILIAAFVWWAFGKLEDPHLTRDADTPFFAQPEMEPRKHDTGPTRAHGGIPMPRRR